MHIAVSDILDTISLREMVSRRKISTTASIEAYSPFSLLPRELTLDTVGIEDAYPVTPFQEGIIADSLLSRANYVYRRVYTIKGVTLSQLKSALEAVIARSNILRTTFFPWKRTYLQAVRKSIFLPWKTPISSTLKSYMEESANEDMPLDEPLVRAAIVAGDLLVLDMHHALFDHWSSQNIFTDAISILRGQKPISRAPFSTYVAYQQTRHDEEAKRFWKDDLSNAKGSVLTMPASMGSSSPLVVSSSITKSLSNFCKANGITMGALFHAAWALTLSAQLKTSDVLFMTGFSGRDADVEDILMLDGPTLCCVPMRVSVDGSLSALTFTKAVQKNLWNLSRYAHSGLRNALVDGGLNANVFNTMINVLVSTQGVADDSHLYQS